MDANLLETLKAIDLNVLTDVVRQDQRNPAFEITNWSVERLSDKGIINPDGLWLFSGDGKDGARPQSWSIVLKIFERPAEETPPSDLWYWKRELLWAQAGLIAHLPGPVKSPRYYRVEETDDGARLWQEHVENHRPNPWSLVDYAFAARQLGLWNGAYVCGTPLPDQPWFTRQHYRSWYTQTNPEQDLQLPLNQTYIVAEIRERYERLWTEREMFYRVLETLPQAFSHFDTQRRNLFIRKGSKEQEELVLVDWAVCGFGPLGAELFSLIGMSAALLAWPPSEVEELEKAAFPSYLQGLSEAGWHGNTDTIRLAYNAWISVWFGIIFPNLEPTWCSPDSRSYALQQFGYAEEDLYLQWLPLLPYSLDCADEARSLMKRFGTW